MCSDPKRATAPSQSIKLQVQVQVKLDGQGSCSKLVERTRLSHKIQGSQIQTTEYREGGDPLDYPTKEKHDIVKSTLRMSLWRSEQSTILSRIAGAIRTRQEILVNGHIVNVTTNLGEALRRLRVQDPGSSI